jgi:PST family polysaccharide transporter
MTAPAAPAGATLSGMKSIAIRGGLAVGLSQAVQIAARLVSVVALSRLLNPGDFGLIAALAPVISFTALVQGLGLQQAVVRHWDLPAEQVNRIFWLMLAVSLACAGLVAASAPAVAAFYRDERMLRLTEVAAVPLVLASLTSVPSALLSRGLRFGTVALIDAGSAVAGLLAALLAAWLGAGYWSLLAATFAATTVNLLASWAASGWVPAPPSLRLPDRKLLGFGANLSGFTIVNFFARNLDNILIGRVSGPTALGYYDRAYTLMLFPLQTIMAPISGVMVPLLSRIASDKPQLRSVYLRTMGQIVLLTVPGMAALASASDDVIGVLFGPQWAPAAPIFALLGWAALVQPIGSSTGWLFVSQGRTRAMFYWGLFGSSTTVASFVAGLPWGAVGVAAAYTVSEYLVRIPALFRVIAKVGPVTVADLAMLQFPLLAAAAVTKLIHDLLLRRGFGLSGPVMIASTVLLSYALAIVSQVLSAAGRSRLAEALDLSARVVRLRV